MRSSATPIGSSTSRTGRSSVGASAGIRPSGVSAPRSSGAEEKRSPETTSMGGSTPVSARTMVDLAVPFSPRMRTPPTAGDTAVRMRASAMSSDPTTALNG